MINQYVLGDFIGQGQFGKVKMCFKDEVRYAIKILKKTKLARQREFTRDANGNMVVKSALQDVQREIAIMKKLDHQNVIRLYEVIENPNTDKIYLIMEIADPGQIIEWDDADQKFFLYDDTTDLTEERLRIIFRDVLKGLHQLHQNNIIHRDLKPQNILLGDGGKAKIADFGVSLICSDTEKLSDNKGTYHFMAPEMFQKDIHYSGKAADIWSLGVTFFSFAFLSVPFNGESIVDLTEAIKEGTVEFPQDPVRSDQLKAFLALFLNKDPNLRPSVLEIAANEWINEGCDNLLHEIQTDAEAIQHLSQAEIDNAFSIATFVMLKSWVKNWKDSHGKLGKSDSTNNLLGTNGAHESVQMGSSKLIK